MSKKKKIIIAIIIAIPILLILTDVLLVKAFKTRPIFSIPILKYKDGGSTEYWGLGYKVIKCNTLSGDKSIHLGFYNLNVDKVCNHDLVDDPNGYTIVDETDICADALEEIYRDEEFIYYFPCIKSETMFLKYNDGYKISIKDALKNDKVTFDELLEKGLEVYKYPITEDSANETVKEDSNNNTSQNSNNNKTNSSNSNKNSNDNNDTSSSSNNNNNNNQNNNSDPSINQTPLHSWKINDFSILKYGSKEKAFQECDDYGETHFSGSYFYFCTDVENVDGILIGYMLRLKEFDTGNDYNWR